MNTSSDPWVVVDECTIETSFGWLFSYTSKKYLDTGNELDCLYGNGPVLFNRYTGEIEFYGTGGWQGDEKCIEDYERKLHAEEHAERPCCVVSPTWHGHRQVAA